MSPYRLLLWGIFGCGALFGFSLCALTLQECACFGEIPLAAGGQVLQGGGEELVAAGADAAVAEFEGPVPGQVVGAELLEGQVANGAVGVQVFVPAQAEAEDVAVFKPVEEHP